MLSECCRTAKYYELHPCTSDGYIHATEVLEETYLARFVGPYHRNQYDVALLSLEAINRIHADEPTIRLEEFAFSDEPAEILHLCTVGRYDTDIYLLVEYALLAYLFEIFL